MSEKHTKYILGKDLPYAKAGSRIAVSNNPLEHIYVITKLPKGEEDLTEEIYIGDSSDLGRLIADGWVQEVDAEEDMGYKTQRMRQIAEDMFEKKIKPLEYYFCRWAEPGEDYLIPIPAQHPVLETPIFKIVKIP